MIGNHEYYTGDVDGWLKELEYLGVTPLHNSHVMLTHPEKSHAKICLVGVDDVEGGFLRWVICWQCVLSEQFSDF